MKSSFLLKKGKLLFIISLFSIFCGNIQSQSQSELREIFDDAQYFFNREEYSEALFYYLQLLQHEPNNANFNFKAGSCLLNIKGVEAKAIPYLEKAIKNTTVNYKERSFNEDRAPFHAYYFLGNAYRINNQIDKALDIYDQFINSPDFVGNYNLRIVKDEIKSCERAKIIKDNPIKYSIYNLGEGINTSAANYQAVISGDQNTIVYMTTLKFYEGIFSVRKIDGKWTPPSNLNPEVISDGNIFPTGLSYDGNTLFLVKKEEIQNDLYVSYYQDGRWSAAKKLNSNINTNKNEDYASVSKDGKTLFFTSNRRGGEGGMDIYMSEKGANGDWGEAINLGPVVNSPFNETSVFITENDNRLYFSSDGHFNMGGYDIFYSEYRNGEWDTPKNIGFPINTTSDNTFFVPIENGKYGLMSLNLDDGYGEDDIYKIEIGPKDPNKEIEMIQSFQKMEEVNNNVVLKLIDTDTKDTLVIKFNKETDRFDMDIPENLQIIVEEE